MDDETLAPMADALSATLAVIVLLICFFILAQVVAVSKQIEVQKIGDAKYIEHKIDINFKELEAKDGRLSFFKSFNPEENKALIDEYLTNIKASCSECKNFKIISNYPASNASKTRSQRRALSNAMKLLPFVLKQGMDYDIELSNVTNYYYLEVVPQRSN